MGTDVYCVVGRRKQLKLTNGDKTSELSLNAFGGSIQFGDLEFERVPSKIEPDRNYRLFAWLAARRGNIKPAVDIETLRDKTVDFMEWVDSEYGKTLPKNSVGRGTFWEDVTKFYRDYYQTVFYPTAFLTSYEYDQIALVEDEKSDPENPTYFAHEEGKTYRQLFDTDCNYFEFLQYLVDGRWEFVLFGFDN